MTYPPQHSFVLLKINSTSHTPSLLGFGTGGEFCTEFMGTYTLTLFFFFFPSPLFLCAGAFPPPPPFPVYSTRTLSPPFPWYQKQTKQCLQPRKGYSFVRLLRLVLLDIPLAPLFPTFMALIQPFLLLPYQHTRSPSSFCTP